MLNNRDRLVAEMRDIVREAAEPRPAADSVKAALRRASRSLGITYRRARTFWYGTTEQVRVNDAEADRLRAEADRLRAEADRLRLLRLERLEREIAKLRAEVRRRDAEAEAKAGGRSGMGGGAAAPFGPLAAPLKGCA